MKVFSEALVEEARIASRVADLSQATIGEVLLVAQYLERKTGIPFIRMDQGSPGLPPNHYGVEAEKEALDRESAPNIRRQTACRSSRKRRPAL